MLNNIKILVVFLVLALVAFLPKISYASDDRHGHDHGRDQGQSRGHDEHRFHARNPDLTLVSGMDNIDSRILVDSAPDPAPEEIVQYAPQDPSTIPSTIISPDADGNFIINVPNNAGGYTPIRIQKSGNGYIGPQGELYYPFPEISQLKVIYGI